MHAHNVYKMKADSENTRNKENREIIESVLIIIVSFIKQLKGL